MADEAKAPEPADIARAMAVANGHPDPDSYVARFSAALVGDPLPVDEPAAEAEQTADAAEAPAQQEG